MILKDWLPNNLDDFLILNVCWDTFMEFNRESKVLKIRSFNYEEYFRLQSPNKI